MKATVIGAGSWGTALGATLAAKGIAVTLWSRGREVADYINANHCNGVYLPGLELPVTLRAETNMEAALQGASFVVAVVPSHVMRETMEKAAPYIDAESIVVSASKGVEDETLLTMHGVLEQTIGGAARIGAISGPSFAVELAQAKPTVVVAAAESMEVAEKIQTFFAAPTLRVYSSNDLVGVELGGVVKNVMAIATGVCDGLGYGLNARAATITRGLAEMTRLAVALGARLETLSGLSGIGDLVLTCTGDLSRNRQVGLRIGRGESIDEILSGMRMVAEGVRNTQAVKHLAQKKGVEVPIVECAYKVLYEGMPAERALYELFGRRLKPEFH